MLLPALQQLCYGGRRRSASGLQPHRSHQNNKRCTGLQVACNLIEVIKTTRDVITIGQNIRHGGEISRSFLQEAQALRNTSLQLQSSLQPLSGKAGTEDCDLLQQCRELSKCAIALESEAAKYSSASSAKRLSVWQSWKRSTRYVVGGKDKLAELSAQLQRHEQHLTTHVNLRLGRHTSAIKLGVNTSLAQLDLVLTKVAAMHQDMTAAIIGRDEHQQHVQGEAQQRQVLKSLFFDQMQLRRDSIPLAYHSTFEWIFKKPDNLSGWSGLSDWLSRTSSSCYWISGKPGSGKSTLMRFIEDHQVLQQIPATEDGLSQINVASFYFWQAGTPLQGSVVGALRCLLYTMLSAFPRSIPEMQICQSNWTYQTLCRTIQRFLAASEQRWLILLDGLDESSDERQKLDDFLTFLRSSPKCQLICSGRPEQRFERYFEKTPKMRLHDLTSGDLEAYARSRLEVPLESATHLENNIKSGIISKVVQRADGVFLWVRLITASLIEGLDALESADELWKRLDELPSELDEMFGVMMSRLPERYKKEAEIYFRLLIAVRNASMSISLLELATIDLLSPELRGPRSVPLTLDKLKQHATHVGAFLRVRYASLLEVRTSNDRTQQFSDQIDFTHRSAYEYLVTWHRNLPQARNPAHPFQLLVRAQIELLNFAEQDASAAAAIDYERIYWAFQELHGTPKQTLQELWRALDRSGRSLVGRGNNLTGCQTNPAWWIRRVRDASYTMDIGWSTLAVPARLGLDQRTWMTKTSLELAKNKTTSYQPAEITISSSTS
ncbi:hypothetical protein KVT40_007183 [Elsinoe batatas]|uniref:Nephrocystin 3-like N-terminal domain-containing protein n=1 Tax=Elsinoe batatas TaxID=2601811 RepID=A0A8K0KXY7_9PEZI|nr:hypothetical protein KVT40_007183 [Elsinoe batatas]